MLGKLIIIDGADGCGKATQTKKLIDKLHYIGKDVETLDFPQYQNNYFGHLIRSYLNGAFGDPTKINPYLSSVLYAADRFESSNKIKQWLSKGKIVILDRYVSANQIHQGGKIKDEQARKNFLTWLEAIEHGVFNIPKPDIILYLDISLEVAQNLMAGKEKDMVENDLQYQEDSRIQSLRLISQMNNWHRIICEEDQKLLSIKAIHQKIWETLKTLL